MIKVQNSPSDEVTEFIRSIEAAYPDINAEVVFKPRHRSGKLYGNAKTWTGYIEVYTNPHGKDVQELKATIAHEIGHVHHLHTSPDDFFGRTDYGQEMYAEEFANMCLGRESSNYKATNYRGYARKQIYKEKFPNWYFKQDMDGWRHDEKDYTVYIVWQRDNRAVWRVQFHDGSRGLHSDVETKIETAKKNAVRALRKRGYNI